MALFCKENHCGSCEKAFCCFSCRSKHEVYVHKKTKPESTRKVFASIRNVMFQSHNSLPRILESVPIDFQDIESNSLKKEQRKLLVSIHKDNSKSFQLENRLEMDDKGETPCAETKDDFSETEKECTSKSFILTDNKTSFQTNEVSSLEFSQRNFSVLANIDENTTSSVDSLYLHNSVSSEGTENVPSEQIYILGNFNFSSRTAGNTPPRTQDFKPIDSIPQDQSATNENSSVYCPCFENLTKSGIDSIWVNPKSDRSEYLPPTEILENTENQDHSEKSSVYFGCSEDLSKQSPADKFVGNGIAETEGFNTFEINSEVASTKLEMTISSSPESYFETDTELRTETIDTTDVEYQTANLKEFQDGNINSNIDDISIDNGSQSTLSAYQISLPDVLDSDCSKNHEENREAPEHGPEFTTWLENCETQTETSSNLLEFTFRTSEESKENYLPISKSVDVEVANDEVDEVNTSSTVDHSSAIEDSSIWQSFSNSIQRAYNSTKELCGNIGRKNRSKRELDDVEEIQPAPKRPKISILCRPPIRDNPRIVIRQDGNTRRPVILYDRGTQTDL